MSERWIDVPRVGFRNERYGLGRTPDDTGHKSGSGKLVHTRRDLSRYLDRKEAPDGFPLAAPKRVFADDTFLKRNIAPKCSLWPVASSPSFGIVRTCGLAPFPKQARMRCASWTISLYWSFMPSWPV